MSEQSGISGAQVVADFQLLFEQAPGLYLALDARGEEQLQWARTIQNASKHLLELVDDVLDIARIEADGMAMSVEPIAPSDVLAGALELTEPVARRDEISLHAPDRPIDEIWVLADHQRLKQVLINLIVNAVKYNRPGGEVAVSVDARDEVPVLVKITDTGSGMDAASLTKLFVPFQRLDAGAAGIPGAGLALSLSRMIQSTSQVIEAIGDGVERGEFAVVVQAAHRGRNEALLVGAQELGAAFASVETAARDGLAAEVREGAESVRALWPATRLAIERLPVDVP